MYLETRDASRNGWKFTYKGGELIKAAKEKVAFFAAREEKFRKEAEAAISDRSRAINSEQNSRTQANLAEAATQKEACEVFFYEFTRNPDREYFLGLSDVVFFGLGGHSVAVKY